MQVVVILYCLGISFLEFFFVWVFSIYSWLNVEPRETEDQLDFCKDGAWVKYVGKTHTVPYRSGLERLVELMTVTRAQWLRTVRCICHIHHASFVGGLGLFLLSSLHDPACTAVTWDIVSSQKRKRRWWIRRRLTIRQSESRGHAYLLGVTGMVLEGNLVF